MTLKELFGEAPQPAALDVEMKDPPGSSVQNSKAKTNKLQQNWTAPPRRGGQPAAYTPPPAGMGSGGQGLQPRESTKDGSTAEVMDQKTQTYVKNATAMGRDPYMLSPSAGAGAMMQQSPQQELPTFGPVRTPKHRSGGNQGLAASPSSLPTWMPIA